MNGKVSRKRSACKFMGRDARDRLCSEEERIEEDSCTGICSPPFQHFCPSYKDHLCCQGNGTCKEMKGPCSSDSVCEGSLICGIENCDWAEGVNCCKEKCRGDDCCTSGSPCREDEGVCTRNQDCMDGHTCMVGNCSWDNSKACCTNQTLDKNCSRDYKCLEGQGHCRHDYECQDGLNCTRQSCNWYHPASHLRQLASCCNAVPGLIFSL